MLPRDGSELPRWRRHVMVVVMALVRLAVGWLLVEGPITVLVLRPGFISAAIGAGPRLGVAALLGAGLAAFAWPRSCPYGFALLVAGLFGFEAIWHRLGLPPGSNALWSTLILAVLAGGELLTRRLRHRLYATDRVPVGRQPKRTR